MAKPIKIITIRSAKQIQQAHILPRMEQCWISECSIVFRRLREAAPAPVSRSNGWYDCSALPSRARLWWKNREVLCEIGRQPSPGARRFCENLKNLGEVTCIHLRPLSKGSWRQLAMFCQDISNTQGILANGRCPMWMRLWHKMQKLPAMSAGPFCLILFEKPVSPYLSFT